jgi:predicted metal-dependent enzyme (double-stranded beta helix superfamily)
MVLVRYSLEQFIADMQGLVDSQSDQQTIFDTGSAYLERLVANPDAIPEQFRVPSGTGKRPNHGSYAIHRGPGLFVSSVVWGPGERVGPHDHRPWGMIGVAGNAIEETRFRRVDDRDRENVARLEKDRTTLVKPGDVSLLVPEVDEIHAMDNFSDRSTFEIHVYGQDLVGLPRCQYSLETGQIKSFMSTKFDNC